uniref:Uncharacterized protein n=1 Tax=Seriola dumerili TaxID=41447 RepID=A0A3B4TL30_SERDU
DELDPGDLKCASHLTEVLSLFEEMGHGEIKYDSVQAELQTPVVLRKVQVVLRHADGKGQVAANAPDDDGSADVTGLNLHLPAHSRATTLVNGQAAALTTAASPILKSQRQILSGGLVHLLICTAVIGLEDHCDLKCGETNKINIKSHMKIFYKTNFSRGHDPTLCSRVSQNLFPPTSPHRNSM